MLPGNIFHEAVEDRPKIRAVAFGVAVLDVAAEWVVHRINEVAEELETLHVSLVWCVIRHDAKSLDGPERHSAILRRNAHRSRSPGCQEPVSHNEP